MNETLPQMKRSRQLNMAVLGLLIMLVIESRGCAAPLEQLATIILKQSNLRQVCAVRRVLMNLSWNTCMNKTLAEKSKFKKRILNCSRMSLIVCILTSMLMFLPS